MKKKEKSTALVLFTIFALFLIIILPPIFRKAMPKIDKSQTNENKKIIKLLNCKIDNYKDGYNINVNVKYLNNIFKQNTIKYTPLSNTNTTTTENNNLIPISDQFNLFNSIEDIEIKNNSDGSVVVILKETLIDSNNEELNKYLMGIKDEEEFFTNQGYICTTISS